MVDVAAYFSRIGYDGPARPDIETLKRLHERHLSAVTFENIAALSGEGHDLSAKGLERKIVREGRGGYCFEQNLLFADVLRELGFSVTLLSARVWMGERAPQPKTHAMLRVDIGGAPWIADAGFGSLSLLEPIPLQEGTVFDFPVVSFRLIREGELWILQSNWPREWFDLYGFTLEPCEREDYEVFNHYVATHPKSHFTFDLILSRVQREKRTRLHNRRLTIVTAQGMEEHLLPSSEAASAAARDLFGVAADPALIPSCLTSPRQS